MIKKIIYNKRGFTLVEVIISIAIMGILIIPIISVANLNIRLNLLARIQVTATNLAENIIEELKYSDDIKELHTVNKDGQFIVDVQITKIDRKLEQQEDEQDPIIRKDIYKIIVNVIYKEKRVEEIISYRTV